MLRYSSEASVLSRQWPGLSNEFVTNSGQALYMPARRENRDIVLAGEVLHRSGYSVLWVSWTHGDGPAQATGPFPYDVMVIRTLDFDEPNPGGMYSTGGPEDGVAYEDEFWPFDDEEEE